jgi:hypothetical protein
MRLTVRTPVDRRRSYDVFDLGGPLDLASRLTQIQPDAQDPDKPYDVVLAGIRSFQPVSGDSMMLSRLKARHDARVAVESGSIEGMGQPGGTPDRVAGRTGGRAPGSFGPGGPGGPPVGFNPYTGGGFNPYTGGSFGPGGTTGGLNRPTRPGQAEGEVEDAYKDPVTEESVLDDTVLEIVFAVWINPPGYTPQPTPDPEPADTEQFVDAGN